MKSLFGTSFIQLRIFKRSICQFEEVTRTSDERNVLNCQYELTTESRRGNYVQKR